MFDFITCNRCQVQLYNLRVVERAWRTSNVVGRCSVYLSMEIGLFLHLVDVGRPFCGWRTTMLLMASCIVYVLLSMFIFLSHRRAFMSACMSAFEHEVHVTGVHPHEASDLCIYRLLCLCAFNLFFCILQSNLIVHDRYVRPADVGDRRTLPARRRA